MIGDCLPAAYVRTYLPLTQLCAIEFIKMSDAVRVYQIAGIDPPTVLVEALCECRIRLDDACEEVTHERLRRYWRARAGESAGVAA